MTRRATFGDFTSAARAHLDHAVPPPEPGTRRSQAAARTRQTEAFTQSLRDVIEVMARYLADINAPVAGVPRQHQRLLSPWARAGLEAQAALGNAAAFLSFGRPGTSRPSRDSADNPAPAGLDAAAVSLRTGRDLLHTHFTTGPDGARGDHSEWSQVITSAPVTRALLLEVASWARQIAPQGTALALSRAPAQRHTGDARRRLNAACQSLWILDSAVQAAHRKYPVSAEDAQLLQAIPVNASPARRIPHGTETIPGLCQGTLGSAERIRHIAWRIAPQASWSPGLTADSLRQSAGCGTVISHHCQILLKSLAACADKHADSEIAIRLLVCAEAAGDARHAWLQAARAWNQATTDTRGLISPAAAEAADLALWTGRLAYADPGWTLDLGPSQAVRPPGALAPGRGDLQRVVTAVHHACHTLTQISAADQEQIRTAAGAGRILVPTRSLPDDFDIPHPFAHAPSDRVDQLLTAYRDAGAASTRATAAVARVATAIRAPSQILTTARAAVQAGDGLAANGKQRPAEAAKIRPSPRSAAGPVERILQDLGVTSRSVLLRAAAIDKASEQIILENSPATATGRQRPVPAELSRSTGTAELINHMLATGNPRAAAILHPPAPAKTAEAEAEP